MHQKHTSISWFEPKKKKKVVDALLSKLKDKKKKEKKIWFFALFHVLPSSSSADLRTLGIFCCQKKEKEKEKGKENKLTP